MDDGSQIIGARMNGAAPRIFTTRRPTLSRNVAQSGAHNPTVVGWLVLASICLVLLLAVPSERGKVIFAGIAATACLAIIFLMIRKLSPATITPLFFVGYQIVPAVFFAISMAILGPAGLEEHPIPYILERPFGTFLALVTPSLGFLAFAAVSRLWTDPKKEVQSFRAVGAGLPARFGWLLIFAAILQFSTWITTDSSVVETLPAYFLRILARSVGVVPFVAGFWAFRFRLAMVVWTVGFLLSIGLAFFTGSRGMAFIPMIPFLVGLFFGIETWSQRLKIGLILSPFLGAAFFLSGLIGQVRLETGRLSVSEIGQVGVGTFLAASKDRVKEGNDKTNEEAGQLETAASRLVNWPNIAVPIMTPDVVPYRGLSELDHEFMALFELTKFTGKTYWSNIFAIEYGFYVGETSSVEFGIVADGASRAGWFGAVLYGFIAAAALVALEEIMARIFRQNQGISILCACTLGGIATSDMVRTGIFSSLRLAVTAVAVFAVILPLVNMAIGMFAGEEHETKPDSANGKQQRPLPKRQNSFWNR